MKKLTTEGQMPRVKGLHQHIVGKTGIDAPSSISIFYEDPERVFLTTFTQVSSELIDRVIQSDEPKRITEEKKDETNFPLIRTRLSSYFTPDALATSQLVRDEKSFLEESGYNIETGFYFVIPFPSAMFKEGLFFLIIKNVEDAEKVESFGTTEKLLADL